MRIAIPEQFRGQLDGRLPTIVDAAWYRTREDVARAARGADVLVMGFIDAAEIRAAVDAADSARWVSTHAAGVDHYPFDLLTARNMLLTKGAGINAVPIAEFVVLCVLSAAKQFPFFVTASNRHEWPTGRPPAVELEGSRALIVGYGAIGRAVGERLCGLGVQVTGVRRAAAGEPGVIGPDDWRDRLADFDWVILTAALTGGTRHMVGANELARMRSTAWIFNVARGGLIDHAALAEALALGRPHGAYLDVTEPEPLPDEHPLWHTPNVFITGHSAGRSARSHGRYIDLFLTNLGHFQTGQPLLNLVDYTHGY